MTASDVTAAKKRSLLRPTAFRVGVLAGVVVFLGCWWLVYTWTRPTGPIADFNVEVMSSGAALSRNGAGQLEVRNARALLLRQVCNGACDDLSYRVATPVDDSYSVAILDAKGRCLLCDDRMYVDPHLNLIAKFDLAGDGALAVDSDYYELQGDGSLKRFQPATAEEADGPPKS